MLRDSDLKQKMTSTCIGIRASEDPLQRAASLSMSLADLRRLRLHLSVTPRFATLDPDGVADKLRGPRRFTDISYNVIPGYLFEAMRRSQRWSAAELAGRAGIDEDVLYAIEAQPFSMRYTPPETLRKVAGVFAVPLELLLFGPGEYALLLDRPRVHADRRTAAWGWERLTDEACRFLPGRGHGTLPGLSSGLAAYLATESRAVAGRVATLAAHPEVFRAAVRLVVAYIEQPRTVPMSRGSFEALINARMEDVPTTYELSPPSSSFDAPSLTPLEL